MEHEDFEVQSETGLLVRSFIYNFLTVEDIGKNIFEKLKDEGIIDPEKQYLEDFTGDKKFMKLMKRLLITYLSDDPSESRYGLGLISDYKLLKHCKPSDTAVRLKKVFNINITKEQAHTLLTQNRKNLLNLMTRLNWRLVESWDLPKREKSDESEFVLTKERDDTMSSLTQHSAEKRSKTESIDENSNQDEDENDENNEEDDITRDEFEDADETDLKNLKMKMKMKLMN